MNKQKLGVSPDLTADIMIVGAGIVGLSLAAILVKYTDLSIVIIDRASEQELLAVADSSDATQRVSAINLFSANIWEKLGVWSELTQCAQAYNHMHVWDYFGGKLDFDLAGQSAELGYILPNRSIQQALLSRLLNSHDKDMHERVKFCFGYEGIEISYSQDDVRRQAVDSLQLEVKNNQNESIVINSKYLIAADGANSWVRNKLNIKLSSWSYGHTAIIANVKTAKPHQNTAWQKFTECGPLAFLPLKNQAESESSIVWSVTQEKADELLNKTDQEFMQALGFEFENTLGEILAVSQRKSFSLKMRHIKQYLFHKNILFVGDAAHTVHPLAGLGLNIAMQDALSLANVFVVHNINDINHRLLRAYERERKAEVWQMIAGLEVIKRAYSVKSPLLQSLIHFGVSKIDQNDFLKNYFMNIALGKKIDVPSWL